MIESSKKEKEEGEEEEKQLNLDETEGSTTEAAAQTSPDAVRAPLKA